MNLKKTDRKAQYKVLQGASHLGLKAIYFGKNYIYQAKSCFLTLEYRVFLLFSWFPLRLFSVCGKPTSQVPVLGGARKKMCLYIIQSGE